MICRIWHGWTTHENADPYERLLREEIFAGIDRRGLPGFRGLDLLRRDGEDAVEFVTMMWFEGMEAVRAFAGEDHEVAVVPPAARKLLQRIDERLGPLRSARPPHALTRRNRGHFGNFPPGTGPPRGTQDRRSRRTPRTGSAAGVSAPSAVGSGRLPSRPSAECREPVQLGQAGSRGPQPRSGKEIAPCGRRWVTMETAAIRRFPGTLLTTSARPTAGARSHEVVDDARPAGPLLRDPAPR